MNIRDHIEAGHYERDEHGRALVPMQDGETATILAVIGESDWCLWGWRSGAWPKRPLAWDKHGQLDTCSTPCNWHLLPPSPRKVKVTRWVLMKTDTDGIWRDHFDDRHAAEMCAACYPGSKWTPVELTGEYEEPWS